MPALGLLIPILALTGLFLWSRRALGEEVPLAPRHGRISLLTESVGYVGGVLLLAGGIGALGERWDGLSDALRLALLFGTAGTCLVAGFLTRRSSEPALDRLTDVVWLLAVATFAGGLGVLVVDVANVSDETSFLVIAAGATGLAAILFALHPSVIQHVALYVGLVTTGIAIVGRLDPNHPAWVAAASGWAIGIAWIALGARRLLTPIWVALPLGILTVLVAPSALQEDSHPAMFAVGLATSAGVMAFGVRARFVPGLALGAVGLFAYLTSAVVWYFGDTIGAPAALSITGALILAIAAGAARLARFARTPPASPAAPPAAPPAEQPPHEMRKAS